MLTIYKIIIYISICLFSVIFMIGCNKKDGYSIVNNSLSNIKTEERVYFKKIYSIDVTDISLFNKRNYFKYLVSFDELDNIYIADSFQSKIYKYDNHGMLIKSFGRAGQGPEEFFRINTIMVDGNVLRVFEGGGQVKNISLDGQYISSNRISLQNRMGVKKVKNNYIILAGETDFKNLKLIISISDKDMKKFKKIVEYDHQPGLLGTYEFYMFDWLLVTNKCDLYFPENNMEAYTINQYNSNGEIIRKINREYKIKKYSKEAENRFMKVYKNEIEDRMVEFPNNPPVVNYIFQDLKDNLWVIVGETYEDNRINDYENLIDVFNGEGEILYSFKSKILSKNCIYNNGKIYKISPMDENMQNQYIDVYEIEYK